MASSEGKSTISKPAMVPARPLNELDTEEDAYSRTSERAMGCFRRLSVVEQTTEAVDGKQREG